MISLGPIGVGAAAPTMLLPPLFDASARFCCAGAAGGVVVEKVQVPPLFCGTCTVVLALFV
jgi:hypothetical protein